MNASRRSYTTSDEIRPPPRVQGSDSEPTSFTWISTSTNKALTTLLEGSSALAQQPDDQPSVLRQLASEVQVLPEQLSEQSSVTVGRLLHLWVFGAVCTSFFIVPLFLLLLPYWIGHTKVGAWKEASARNAVLPDNASRGPDDDLFLGLPTSCRAGGASPVSPDDLTGINDNYPDNGAMRLSVRPSAPVLCLYNNSLYRRADGRDFLPRHLPLNLCSGLVYWSMGLAAGRLSSRVPEFERRYGIEQLHRVRAAQGSAIPVYVTVGGHAEDAADMYLLGVSPPTRALFVADVLMNIRRHRLDGVVVHWVAHGSELCRERMKDPLTWLADLLADLRDILALNFPDGSGLVGLMVPADVPLANSMLSQLGDRVDILLLATHMITEVVPAAEGPMASFRAMKSFLERLRAYAELRPKICVSLSLAIYARRGETERPLPATNVSRRVGYRALSELCSDAPFRQVANASKAIVRAAAEDGTWYSVDSYESLRRKLSYGKEGPRDRDMCVLVHDLDMDAYAEPCRGSERYILLRHVLNASTDANLFNVHPYLP
ncbi:hypothetical protein HPB49_010005 [Dermacentor silvarum]|uniref:Uncharacterized protein n=1 Tax=Dermacentor silvarum TaxID=543639 RepID=A0ACB8D4F8_DERSI|nr:hypothetical protein HPB49_010005 [Dermacentor silvarum]